MSFCLIIFCSFKLYNSSHHNRSMTNIVRLVLSSSYDLLHKIIPEFKFRKVLFQNFIPKVFQSFTLEVFQSFTPKSHFNFHSENLSKFHSDKFFKASFQNFIKAFQVSLKKYFQNSLWNFIIISLRTLDPGILKKFTLDLFN